MVPGLRAFMSRVPAQVRNYLDAYLWFLRPDLTVRNVTFMDGVRL
jgi:hypothetical protein